MHILVNMNKEVCENVSAQLILLNLYLQNSEKSNHSLDNKNLKWGGGGYRHEINVFLKEIKSLFIVTSPQHKCLGE